MAEMLSYLLKNKRILNFDKSVPNNTSPPCEIVESFNKANWKYLELEKANQEHGSDIIKLPFKEDFDRLQGVEQDKVREEI